MVMHCSSKTKPGVYVGVEKDYYIKPRKYITAAEDHAMRVEKATIIQCFVRQVQARVMAKELRKARDEKIRAKLEVTLLNARRTEEGSS